jgi:cytoskeletal protein RodZ
MSSVGAYLRELRERRGVSLDEIARSTRVAHRYLEALEGDDFAELPEPVFTKGFVRAYCQVLGESADEAVARYEAWLGRAGPAGPVRAQAAPRTLDAQRRARSAVLVSFVLLLVLGAALVAVTLALQSSREPDRRAVLPAPTGSVPPTTAVPRPVTAEPPPPPQLPRAIVEPTPTPRIVPPSAPLRELAGTVSPYRLVARTREATWVSVRTSDGRASEETIPAGEVREWVSSRPFIVTVGNAGGVAFELNGRKLPPLGARGAVVYRLLIPPER